MRPDSIVTRAVVEGMHLVAVDDTWTPGEHYQSRLKWRAGEVTMCAAPSCFTSRLPNTDWCHLILQYMGKPSLHCVIHSTMHVNTQFS